MDIKRNGSNVWPYVIAGSAIGGAIGYLFMTESGRKIRRAVTHPDELADTIEDARSFIESKAQIVTGQVRSPEEIGNIVVEVQATSSDET